MIIQGYTHHMAAHCENGTTRNLLRFHGLNLSEPLVFGIGSGCFFSYMPFIRVNGLPIISFRPWPNAIFRRATTRLGVDIERRKFQNPQNAMTQLNKLMEIGIPAGLLVGVFHLSYFPPEYRFHFNAHNLVVIGEENGSYFISDPVMENIERLSAKELERVRYAKGTYPPKGRMYWIKKVSEKPDIEQAVIQGIKKNCEAMLRIPVPLFGAKGISYIANRMQTWDSRYGKENAALRLGQFIRMLEEIGTGGAGFRFMYAAFLQEASGILNSAALGFLSEEMTEIGDKWREFAFHGAKNLRKRGVAETSYTSLSSMVKEIAFREEKVFNKLDKLFE